MGHHREPANLIGKYHTYFRNMVMFSSETDKTWKNVTHSFATYSYFMMFICTPSIGQTGGELNGTVIFVDDPGEFLRN